MEDEDSLDQRKEKKRKKKSEFYNNNTHSPEREEFKDQSK